MTLAFAAASSCSACTSATSTRKEPASSWLAAVVEEEVVDEVTVDVKDVELMVFVAEEEVVVDEVELVVDDEAVTVVDEELMVIDVEVIVRDVELAVTDEEVTVNDVDLLVEEIEVVVVPVVVAVVSADSWIDQNSLRRPQMATFSSSFTLGSRTLPVGSPEEVQGERSVAVDARVGSAHSGQCAAGRQLVPRVGLRALTRS